MNKNQVEGKLKDVAGRAERQAGEWAGNSEMQTKGIAKQVEGKLQNASGKIEEAVGKTRREMKDTGAGKGGGAESERDENS